MNGKYRIPLAPDQEPESHPKVALILKMLDQGARYSIKVWNEPIMLADAESSWRRREWPRYCEIRAHGGKAKRSKVAKVPIAPPAIPTVDQLRKRLGAAQDTLRSAHGRLRESLRRQYGGETVIGAWRARENEWLTRRVAESVTHKAIGRAVGLILSRHRVHAATDIKPTADDYATLDAVLGRKVERASKVTERQRDQAKGYLGWIVRTYTHSYGFGLEKSKPWTPEPSDNCIASFLRVKGEVEYLTECLQLATARARKVAV